MKELWNEITYWLSSCKDRNVLEKEYENTIVQCLGLLGWKKYIGEIAQNLLSRQLRITHYKS